jgi:nitrite reductase (NADH) large subunit
VLGHVETEAEVIEAIAALTQLYREQGRYLERIYKWARRVGLATIRQQIMGTSNNDDCFVELIGDAARR